MATIPLVKLPPEKFAKLPKWAQDHIQYVEMRHAEVTRELRAYLDNRKPSEVAIERFQDNPRFLYLPTGVTVAIFLDNDHEKDERLREVIYLRRAYPHRGEKSGPYHLEVSTGSGGYPSIQPQAANVVRIRVAKEH